MDTRDEKATTAPYVVRGKVTYASGRAASGLLVQAFDRDLRSEQLLGRDQTDGRGGYEIRYRAEQFPRAEKQTADLLVRVYDAQGQVYYDPGIDGVLFNAPRQAVVDIHLETEQVGRMSEFERLLRDVRPLLEEVSLTELREDQQAHDITFLQRETGWPADKLEHLVVAHRLLAISKIQADFFYALLRQDLPLRSDLRAAVEVGFAVTLKSVGLDPNAPGPIFYAIVRLDEKTIRQAVNKSTQDALVSAELEKNLDKILEQLKAYRERAEAYFRQEQPRKFFNLIETNLAAGKAEEVRQILQEDALGDLPKLLERLTSLEMFRTAQEADKAGARLAVADVIGFNEIILERAAAQQNIKKPEDVVKLAALNPAGWRKLLAESAEKIQPAGTAFNQRLIKLHASALARKLEKRYPQPAFAAQLERDKKNDLPFAAPLRQVLKKASDFDLLNTNIETYFQDENLKLLPRKDPGAAKEHLKAAQRIFKLAPIYRQTEALMRDGLHSAYSIARMGETRFVSRFGGQGVFTKVEARAVYRKAVDSHNASLFMAGELLDYTRTAGIPALDLVPPASKLEAVIKDFPNLKSLFQGIDLCQCEDCRSIFGPAAYLVDVLEFLKSREVYDTTVSPALPNNAKQVLFDRRPDIGDLDLTCENALTPLPYIDVVNELLEESVAPDVGIPYTGPMAAGKAPAGLVTLLQSVNLPATDKAITYDYGISPVSFMLRDQELACKVIPDGANWRVYRLRQTFAEAAELAAAPEYENSAAYEALRTSKIAFHLPFDLYHREARGYFAQFGIARAELMRALQNAGGPQEALIAADALGISEDERLLIITADAANQKIYWNTGAPPPADVLKVVDTFLQKSELTYAELERLFTLTFINPSGMHFIKHLDETCDTAKKEIANLDNAALDRIHRFLRLQRRLGWNMEALDQAVSAAKIGAGTLDCLPALTQVQALSAALGLAVEQIVAFYSYLPHTGVKNPYDKIFVNEAANGFIEEGLKSEAVMANEGLPPLSQKKLMDYADSLAVILGMKRAELDQLVGALGVSAPVSMANLAALVAFKRLSKKLKLAVDEFLTLQTLCGIDPLANPQATSDFIAKAGEVKAAGTKPTELRYLLQHEATNLAERQLPDKDITAFLEKLQEAFQKAFGETRPENGAPFDAGQSADENKAGLRAWLGRLPGMAESDLTSFMNLVDGVWNLLTPTPHSFIDLKLGEYIETTGVKAAQTALGIGPAVINTKPVERQNFIKAILDALASYFYTQAKTEKLTNAVMDQFKTTQSMTVVFLNRARLKEPPAIVHNLLGELLSTDDLVDLVGMPPIKPSITPLAFPHQYQALRLLHKLAPYAASLGLRAEEMDWLLEFTPILGWMEPDHLPYEGGLPAVSLAKWESIQGALAMIKDYPAVLNPLDNQAPITFYGLMELVLKGGTTLNDVAAYLGRLAGWDETLIKNLDARFAFSTPDLSAYQAPATLRRLETAVKLLRRLGADLTAGLSYIQTKLTETEVKALRLALKSNYAEADWLGVLQVIQDPLREQKRDALVAYLLVMNADLKDSNDLYDIFLIDTQMSACQPTSRIVQAHGSLQLFIQRCLLALEPTAVADVKKDRAWEQWQWMKNYRVWEANRRVFVYPENWIEPELRDDKSQFFTDIETYLKQNELNERNVEEAAASYLEKLDDVALLEVQAIYYEVEIYTMHVFARTRGGDPYTYYYRRFEKERYWTPWEKVDLDISGDHLVTFVRNSRLYLAWPIFTEEANTNQAVPLPAQTDFNGTKEAKKTEKRWKLQMAISEYTGKKWLPKKVSRDPLTNNTWYIRPPSKSSFHIMPLNLGTAGFCFLVTFIDDGLYPDNIPGSNSRRLLGTFAMTGCKGVPVPMDNNGVYFPLIFLPYFKDTSLLVQHFQENTGRKEDDLADTTIFNPYNPLPILQKTPGIFKITYPYQLTLVDWILALLIFLMSPSQQYAGRSYKAERRFLLPYGTFMPYFFEDYTRAYAVVPGFYSSEKQREAGLVVEKTFSDIYQFTEKAVNLALLYWGKLQADPARDLQKILDELIKDDTFIDLMKELSEYAAAKRGYRFKDFYHPLVCYLRETLYKNGIPGLMQPEVQMKDTGFKFEDPASYNPTSLVAKPYPQEDIDFTTDGGYASYNWELFFHLPFEVAVKLSQDQQFEDAMTWFHYIFNPLGARDGIAPQKYWVTKPFFLHNLEYVSQRIDTILYKLATNVGVDDLRHAVDDWRTKPFMPHVIARSRRVAYQKAVVMKYIDNLIAWGDYLFRQDTMESINQATQLYVLADRLLGPKPRLIPPAAATPPGTYNQLESKLDAFGNALLDLENLVPDLGLLPHGGAELPPAPVTLSSLYFCIPANDKMLAYWDRVGDRLFKIRNCMNIEGVERQLALFAPPIDPGALVRAAAAGLSIADILAELNAPLPAYRFKVMVQKAQALAQQVSGLGGALLQALEKRDGEKLGLLRSAQEIQLLQAVKEIKMLQAQEAKVQIEAVQKSIEVTQGKMEYYRSREFMNSGESTAQELNAVAAGIQALASAMDIVATVAHLIPDFNIGASGFGGSPHATAKFGGVNVGNSSMSAADMLRSLAANIQTTTGLIATLAGYQRRQDEWNFQGDQADKEIRQLQQQQEAVVIRQQIAEQDVKNQDLQIENSQAVDAYLHEKFTNDELYDWMVGQISTVYFQAYQLALTSARKAERCYRHELGRDDSFIQAGYWDSLRKGLQAADQLIYDLNRMETAYLDQNKREYELTKHVSLAQLDPLALAELKSNGKCTFTLPEAVFDLDHPGHYFRRIKSVSLSIPCVTGPYTTVSAKLSLLSNKYRKVTSLVGGGSFKDQYQEDPGNDPRFTYNQIGIQSIATSRAQEDSGMFEVDFQDERYLPFEGGGAISAWQLEMADKLRPFDYETISDVIVHLKYTARDGGSGFKTNVESALFEMLSEMTLSASKSGLYQAFSMRRNFPEAFYRFKTDKTLVMKITGEMLPFFSEGHTPNLEGTTFLARLKNNPASYAMTLDGAALTLNKGPLYKDLCVATPLPNPLALDTDFTLAAANTDDLEELVMVVRYTLGS